MQGSCDHATLISPTDVPADDPLQQRQDVAGVVRPAGGPILSRLFGAGHTDLPPPFQVWSRVGRARAGADPERSTT